MFHDIPAERCPDQLRCTAWYLHRSQPANMRSTFGGTHMQSVIPHRTVQTPARCSNFIENCSSYCYILHLPPHHDHHGGYHLPLNKHHNPRPHMHSASGPAQLRLHRACQHAALWPIAHRPPPSTPTPSRTAERANASASPIARLLTVHRGTVTQQLLPKGCGGSYVNRRDHRAIQSPPHLQSSP